MARQHREDQREAVAVDPGRRAARRHDLGRRDQRLHLDQQRPGSLHRAEHDRAGAGRASPTNRADGSVTSTRPPCRISKTPTSLVAPKRFLSARSVRKVRSRSPSKCSTQSTRCSRARGPAREPSLVTWPIRISVTSSRFAVSSSAEVASRTAPTLPGRRVGDRERLDRVDHAGGRPLRLERGEHGLERGLGEHRHRQRRLPEPLGATADLRRGLLAGDVEDLIARRGDVGQRHAGQRALADPGSAAEQNQRARAPGRRPAPGRARRSLCRAAPSARPARRGAGSASARRALGGAAGPARAGRRRAHLLERVPGAAARALPGPGERGVPALGALKRG